MKDLEVGDTVRVRGLDTIHEVTSVIGRTGQVHLKCLLTGTELQYVDASAVKIIPVYDTSTEKKNDGIGLGDTVAPLTSQGQKYTVIGLNVSKGTYDLCNINTKKIIRNVSLGSFVKCDLSKKVKPKINNGDRVTIKGYNSFFTVVNTYMNNDNLMVDLLQLVTVQSDSGSYAHPNRIDNVSADAVQHAKDI